MTTRIRRMGSTRWAHAGVMALLIGMPSNAAAQTYQGGLRGAVRDADGVVPGAAVVLTNVETGFEPDDGQQRRW